VSVLYLSCAIVLTVIAHLSYKYYYRRHDMVYLVVAIALFVLVPLMNYLALRELSLSVVYMAAAITYVLILISARCVLGEAMEARHKYATVLIISGVFIFNV